jgi:hypothetical protein
MDENAYNLPFHRWKSTIILCPDDVCKKKEIEKGCTLWKMRGKPITSLKSF